MWAELHIQILEEVKVIVETKNDEDQRSMYNSLEVKNLRKCTMDKDDLVL